MQMLAALDANNDGMIDFDEFTAGMGAFLLSIEPTRLRGESFNGLSDEMAAALAECAALVLWRDRQ